MFLIPRRCLFTKPRVRRLLQVTCGGSYYDSERSALIQAQAGFSTSISRYWYDIVGGGAGTHLGRSARDLNTQVMPIKMPSTVDKESRQVGGADERDALVWKFGKGERRVVWVACGCERSDEADPLDLPGFPCRNPRTVLGGAVRWCRCGWHAVPGSA
jgi:hypothetical protein